MKIRKTKQFNDWLDKLKNHTAKSAILARLTKIAETDHLGQFKRFGNVSELRFDIGPGYRVYFTMKGTTLIILLVGGDKKSQKEDFKRAHKLAEQISEED